MGLWCCGFSLQCSAVCGRNIDDSLHQMAAGANILDFPSSTAGFFFPLIFPRIRGPRVVDYWNICFLPLKESGDQIKIYKYWFVCFLWIHLCIPSCPCEKNWFYVFKFSCVLYYFFIFVIYSRLQTYWVTSYIVSHYTHH